MADVKYDISVDVNKGLSGIKSLIKNLKKTDKEMDKVDNKSIKLSKSFSKMKASLVGLVGSLGLGALVKVSIESADAMGKVANKVGLSVKALQQYRYEADLSGVSTRTFDTAIQRFSRRVGEAAKGQGVLKNTFKELNISLFDQKGKLRSVSELYLEYGDAIRKASSSQEKLRLANKAFDTDGAALVNIFSSSATAAKKLREEAPLLTKEHTEAAARAADAWTKLQKVFGNIIQQLSIALSPAIVDITNRIREFANNKEAIQKMVNGITSLGNAFVTLSKVIGTMLANLQATLIAFTTLKIAMAGGVFKSFLKTITGIGSGFLIAGSGAGKFKFVLKGLKIALIAIISLIGRLSIIGLAVWGVVEVFQALFKETNKSDKAIEKLNKGMIEFTKADVNLLTSKLDKVNTKVLNIRKNAKVRGGLSRDMEVQLQILEKEQNRLFNAIQKGNAKIEAEKNKQQTVKKTTSNNTADVAVINDNSASISAKNRAESVRNLALSFLPLKKAQEEYLKTVKDLNEVEINATFTEDDKRKALENAAKAYSENIKQIQGITLESEKYRKSQEAISAAAKRTAELYTPILSQQRKFKQTEKELQRALKDKVLTTKEYKVAMNNLKKEMEDFNDQQLRNSKTWGDGWKVAMKDYVDNARDASQEAQDLFRTATQGMEDAIVGFTRTGKFEWKSMLNDITNQLLRSEIKKLMANIFSGGSSSAPSQAPGGGIGGGSSSGLGGLLKGIGKIFGGFFANGGVIPAGKVGIVGERGPELATGPTGISPLSNQSNATNVTYNINAVDAQSFKQMVASDPTFLFAVTEEGRRSLPNF